MTTPRRYNWINKDDSSELLNINSIEEFYQKIKFLLDRKDKSFTTQTLKSIIEDLIKKEILPLDSKYIDNLKIKYPFISEDNWPDDITNLVYDLGEYQEIIMNEKNKFDINNNQENKSM